MDVFSKGSVDRGLKNASFTLRKTANPRRRIIYFKSPRVGPRVMGLGGTSVCHAGELLKPPE